MSALQAVQAAIEIWGAFFCLVAFAVINLTQKSDRAGAKKLSLVMLVSSVLMVFDSLAWIFRGQSGKFAFFAVRTSNFLAFFFGFLLIPLIARYIFYILKKRGTSIGRLVILLEWLFFSVGMAFLVLNVRFPFMYAFDENNRYYRLDYAFLPALIGIVGLLVILVVVFSKFKQFYALEKLAVLLYLLLPIVAGVLQIFHYGVSLVNLSIILSSLLLFFSYEYEFLIYNINLSALLSEERIRLVNKQIQPHFIFNCIGTIRYLIQNDPDEAITTLNSFSGYMRSMTDLLETSKPIPAKKEFELLENLVNLEKKRFGNQLEVNLNFENDSFSLPAFCVVTLLENAIKHGVRSGKVSYGIVGICSFKENGANVIEVTDNGQGFDASSIFEDENSKGVGLKNTKKRLEVMCGGTLEIESGKNGTKAKIIIPEQK